MPISMPDALLQQYANDKDHFQHVLDHLFVPAIKKIGYAPIPPTVAGSDIIHAEIIHNLETADLVLCDMSASNPNVFFELGIRTAVDMPVSLVKDQFTLKVPFDTTLINHHNYNASLAPWLLENEIQRLSEHLTKTINNSGTRNTLWKYFGLTTRAELPTTSSVDEKLNLIIQAIERNPAHINQLPISQIITPGDPLKSEKQVISFAQQEAEDIAAEFTIVSMEPGKVVLDLGTWYMHDSLRKDIVRFGKEHGVKVVIQGGVDDLA